MHVAYGEKENWFYRLVLVDFRSFFTCIKKLRTKSEDNLFIEPFVNLSMPVTHSQKQKLKVPFLT